MCFVKILYFSLIVFSFSRINIKVKIAKYTENVWPFEVQANYNLPSETTHKVEDLDIFTVPDRHKIKKKHITVKPI